MATGKAAKQGAGDLSDILGGDREPEHIAADAVGNIVADDAGDAGQEPAQRQAHQEAQADELPALRDEGLRDQQQRRDGKRADDDVPMADAVGELAKARSRQDGAKRRR